MEVTFRNPSGFGPRGIAAFRAGGRLVAVLVGYAHPFDFMIARLSIVGEPPHHHLRADGTCATPRCRKWHGAWIDMALEAGWQCPALDAAVAARLERERALEAAIAERLATGE